MADGKAEVPRHDQAAAPDASSLKVADQRSGPDISDAEEMDAPVRSASPQDPLAPALDVGAGEHVVRHDPLLGLDGRWYATVQDARVNSIGYMPEDELDKIYGPAEAR